MLKLGMQKEPYWLDLVSDVKVKVRPLSMAIYNAARSRAWADADKAAGITRDSEGKFPEGADFSLLNSLYNGFFAQHLARYGIEAWEGVQLADNSGSADCTPDNAAALMLIPSAGSAFLNGYTQSLLEVITEGNA
jgi:hypothetical protein